MTRCAPPRIGSVAVGFINWGAIAAQARAAEFAAFQAEADHALLHARRPDPEPDTSTPGGRALAILGPHLDACPLYNAGRPTPPPLSWTSRA